MMRAMGRRVHRLEEHMRPMLEAARKAEIPETPSASDLFVAILRLGGVERGPCESWCDAAARAMGWSIDQLRAEMQAGTLLMKMNEKLCGHLPAGGQAS